jgi:hypothetical protein
MQEISLEWWNTGMEKDKWRPNREGGPSGWTDVHQAPRGSDLDETSSIPQVSKWLVLLCCVTNMVLFLGYWAWGWCWCELPKCFAQDVVGGQEIWLEGKTKRTAAAWAAGRNAPLMYRTTNAPQYSVCCTLCNLWCHQTCAGISDDAFKGLERQAKEMGQSFWACWSCLNFATKVNHQFKEVTKRLLLDIST